MSESGGYHGSDSAQVRHEDKCRWWDDEEFCDCGAEPSQEVIDLRSQLTAALAERDEAREERDRYKGWADDAAAARDSTLESLFEARERVKVLESSLRIAETVRKASNTAAWQQGAEAMREAAKEVASTRQRELRYEHTCCPNESGICEGCRHDEATQIELLLRALPVPERKEG